MATETTATATTTNSNSTSGFYLIAYILNLIPVGWGLRKQKPWGINEAWSYRPNAVPVSRPTNTVNVLNSIQLNSIQCQFKNSIQ